MIAEKYNSDEYMENGDYAIIGGISVEEINNLEREFLGLIDFELSIKKDKYNTYYEKLENFGKKIGIILDNSESSTDGEFE